MSLATAPLAAKLLIRGVRGESNTSYRLMELGFIDGVEARVLGRAPFGDPLRVRVGDCDMSIRSADAALVDIARCD